MLNRMKARTGLLPLALVLTMVISGTATLSALNDPNIFVNVTSNQDKAADNKFGKEYHESLRDMLENRMFNAIKAAYPCVHYLDQSAAEQMVGVERMRELLGGEGESRLPAIANAVGASHMGMANVTVMGGTVVITGSIADPKSASASGRAQATAPAGNNDAISAAMAQFVSKLVASTGSAGPKCSGWQGEISASSSLHEKGKNPNGDPFTIDTDLKITCQMGKNDNDPPPCQVSYSYKMAGKDSSITSSSAGEPRCVASAGIYNGIGKVRVGPCRFQATRSIAVAGFSASDKNEISVGGWDWEFPVPRDARQLTGSKQVDKATTLNWNLTYK
jgi:hypothetical protein